ncbi:MAG: NADH-quinone oxidoreductase subunit G [Zoogloeaceae bacterium]|nr:NADH-quinone oxidoreductase subunit G [Zoogloeaceae bacterium]
MLDIEIDGISVQVPDGSTVMDAATKVGAYVPHFCYHKKLSIAANCRMCLVQVEKAPKPLPACATPVTNGMKVWTHSEGAIKAQKGVMEFLLINHPLDCPICDQGGECQLQDLAVGYGGVESRYQEEKRVVFNKNLGPLVATDMTRCINCTRCVRFTQEIAGVMELGQAFRGERAEIMPFVEKTVDSELSGNIIDLCPVGALTSKPFRFSARTWELSRRKSISPHDSLGANLIVQLKHDQVKRVLPLENEEINECWLSDRDRFSYEGLNSPDRLTKPMIKVLGEWKETDWQTALEAASKEIKGTVDSAGAAAFGALISPNATLEELHLAQKLVRGLGSDNIDFRLRQTDFRLDGAMTGAPWLGMAITEISSLDRLLIVGSFFRKDAPLLAQRVRQASRRGLRVSAVGCAHDDWLIKTAERISVRPSELVPVLLQLVQAIASSSGKTVSPALDGRNKGEIGDEVSGMASELLAGSRVAVWVGALAEQHGRFAEILGIAAEIARLTNGRFGVIGQSANGVGGYLAKAFPQRGGMNALGMVNNPPKALLVFGAEPSFDFADGEATRSALNAAQSVVCMTAFKSDELFRYATVLLPIAPFAETSGTYINAAGVVQSCEAAAPAKGQTRPGWKVLRVLGNFLGQTGFEQESSEAVRCEVIGSEGVLPRGSLCSEVPMVPAAIMGEQGLERVSDIPIYAVDSLVRRAPSLQKTKDAASSASARINPSLAQRLAIEGAEWVQVAQGPARAKLRVVFDEAVPEGAIQISGATPETAHLGPLSGLVTVERA